jgi:hypothetical protein
MPSFLLKKPAPASSQKAVAIETLVLRFRRRCT